MTKKKEKKEIQPRRPVSPWLFAIEFPDKTIALCRGMTVTKLVIQGEKPDNWQSQKSNEEQG